ncbi:MAG: phosphoribosyl-AMP cyclohydrolase [Pelagibacteraceae bacterium]|nr:phosphoribosyl-AMP cyclohydrolase [Pelagibacteraceae bacterium]|tara:strand:+ start:4378 stop:4689 length:312 start_codon:yes stop_codon:yes gene_type:complete
MIDEIKYNSEGLIPVIIQEYKTNEVLMLAWMNQESLEKTIKTKQTVFWSRSRNTLWKKGETSGNIQIVKEIKIDCDRDALIIKVDAKGPACHTGEDSCFFKNI